MSTITIKAQPGMDKMARLPDLKEAVPAPIAEEIKALVESPNLRQVEPEQKQLKGEIPKNTIVFSDKGLQVLNEKEEVVFEYPSRAVAGWYETLKKINTSDIPKVEA